LANQENQIRKQFKKWRIFIPAIIGLGISFYLLSDYFYRDFTIVNASGKEETKNFLEMIQTLQWTSWSWFWLFAAFTMMIFRDLAYMYRIRVLTDKDLSWRRSFDVIMMWEFASAVTPSMVGGSGVAMFIMHREGITLGRSTAIVMITMLMDELFYITIVPIVMLFVSYQALFPEGNKLLLGMDLNMETLFWIGYGIILMITITITISIFFAPQLFKRILFSICKLPFLRTLRTKAITLGNEMITTSNELRGKKKGYWLRSIGATYFSWISRYLVVNFLILLFCTLGWGENLLLLARQLIMFVIVLVSPTPGGSGIAEFAFTGFFGDIIEGGVAIGMAGLITVLLSFLWRLVSYYPYLIIGSIILPKWFNRTKRK